MYSAGRKGGEIIYTNKAKSIITLVVKQRRSRPAISSVIISFPWWNNNTAFGFVIYPPGYQPVVTEQPPHYPANESKCPALLPHGRNPPAPRGRGDQRQLSHPGTAYALEGRWPEKTGGSVIKAGGKGWGGGVKTCSRSGVLPCQKKSAKSRTWVARVFEHLSPELGERLPTTNSQYRSPACASS